MSIILGINCFHTDTSACLIKNGKLVFAIEEERLNREKHTSKFPILSITGIPLLLNTSFNENEPIVRAPEEAIECLLRTNMDGLFINNFLIKKNT